MSYLALARKWRPTTFQQVVGQTHVLTALENALAHNRLHHAYLFSGTRGVGKTTIGRLLAKGLNCETGITATPCGQCDTCMEIDQGRYVDLLEIDAASRTKVEDTRDLLDNVQYKPARGRFKVYLIDEVHMLSRHSFNALLKTLEEPPEYVKFLLATTDPQKLPVTILSRCLQFHLKPISVDDIHQQLESILSKESVPFEQRALGLLSHAADGSMRDALSLTDQAIALGNGHIKAALVADMLGTLDTAQAIHLLEAISQKQPQAVMEQIQHFAENGVDWDGLLQQLAAQLHRIAMYQALPTTLDSSQPDAEKVALLSRALNPQDVQLFYQIAIKGRDDLPRSPTERAGIEMIVLRMMAFRPAKTISANVISTATTESVAINESQPIHVERPEAASSSLSQVSSPSQSSTELGHSQASSMEQNQSMPEPSYPLDEQPPLDSYHDIDTQDTEVNASSYTPESYAVESNQGIAEEIPRSQSTTEQPNEDGESQASSIGSLRHQLRSRRKGLNTGDKKGGTGGKKFEAARPSRDSVLQRVSQKHDGTSVVSQVSTEQQVVEIETPVEPYQWKPSQVVEDLQSKDSDLTPSQIKSALEHIKTPEMMEKLVQESVEKDEWAAIISQLNTSKLVEQLALNSSFSKSGTSIALALRQSHAHLNTDKAKQELVEAIEKVTGNQHQLTIEVGDTGLTPFELREEIYQHKLKSAIHTLENDENVRFLKQRFVANLDTDSVRPI
ncbi:DNA polymerase III subunit gamma/tau [Vibrio sp. S4M6]|uniref:DNA polymerase III subunit gamma/tau n=1 Tax=Vibrio sinus TaxID=2946865 RepID=UPI00202AA198|nr:DNA polymerase III subunit gamma/tau [Vibrio sinus]MCL9781804.1 DNA polymerase III subunit gamma/tau [Vibrio sinus]